MAFKLLHGFNNVQVFSKTISDTDETIEKGMFVTLSSDKAALPSAAGTGPFYLVISDENDPSVAAAGTYTLLFGRTRIETDKVDATYLASAAAGDVVTVGTDGKLLEFSSDSHAHSVGIVEYVLNDGTSNTGLRVALL